MSVFDLMKCAFRQRFERTAEPVPDFRTLGSHLARSFKMAGRLFIAAQVQQGFGQHGKAIAFLRSHREYLFKRREGPRILTELDIAGTEDQIGRQ